MDKRNSSFAAAILFFISEILPIIRMIDNTCGIDYGIVFDDDFWIVFG